MIARDESVTELNDLLYLELLSISKPANISRKRNEAWSKIKQNKANEQKCNAFLRKRSLDRGSSFDVAKFAIYCNVIVL